MDNTQSISSQEIYKRQLNPFEVCSVKNVSCEDYEIIVQFENGDGKTFEFTWTEIDYGLLLEIGRGLYRKYL